MHLYDPHDPYDPPEPYKTKYASAPYDGEIAYVDAAVGKLLSWLRLRGLYDGALIAVMADHGEALGEHGETTHGIFLYDETIRVPLVFKLPRERSAGKRIESRAGLVDVLPNGPKHFATVQVFLAAPDYDRAGGISSEHVEADDIEASDVEACSRGPGRNSGQQGF